jgi:hypothetical protein
VIDQVRRVELLELDRILFHPYFLDFALAVLAPDIQSYGCSVRRRRTGVAHVKSILERDLTEEMLHDSMMNGVVSAFSDRVPQKGSLARSRPFFCFKVVSGQEGRWGSLPFPPEDAIPSACWQVLQSLANGV